MFNFDNFGRLRDCYFPYPGEAKHIGEGQMHRIGIFVDGKYSWLDDGSWEIVASTDISSTGHIAFLSRGLGIEIDFTDVLYNEEQVFVRRIMVANRIERERIVRIFFNVQYEIAGTFKGDTAFYDPALGACVHYEGDVAILTSGQSDSGGVIDWAVGLSGIEGKEGTWRDAEDGVLSKNAIEHGRCDATFAIETRLEGNQSSISYQWYCVAKGVKEVSDLHRLVLDRTPAYIHSSAQHYWHAWVTRTPWNMYALGAPVVDLFLKSQFTLRAHVGSNGAIIASGDADMLQGGRDTYCYVWPRDGAIIASALAMTGDYHTARNFFRFCTERIAPEGYLAHKFRPDGSLGSSWHGWIVNGKRELPIQEDEVATVLWALWEYWSLTHDIEFVEELYNSFIKKAAYFLAAYRDPYTGLPRPSYDLWEERFSIHTYTAAAASAGLSAAAHFASLLGKERSAEDFTHVAEELREAIMRECYDEANGVFYRSLDAGSHNHGSTIPDKVVDASSALGAFRFGVLPHDDPRLARIMERTRERLSITTPVGGIARYEGDKYFRVNHSQPGSPWIITELWWAQWQIEIANSDDALDGVRQTLARIAKIAGSCGVLPEQRDPDSGAPLSATPLAWSHAEYIRTIVLYLERCRELGLIDKISN